MDTDKEEPAWVAGTGKLESQECASAWDESAYAVGTKRMTIGWDESVYAVKPKLACCFNWLLRELIVCIFRDVVRGGTQQSPSGYEIPVLAPYIAPGKDYGQHPSIDTKDSRKGTLRRPHAYEDIDEVARGKRTVVDDGANDATRVYDLADKNNRIMRLASYEVHQVRDWNLVHTPRHVGDGATQDESSF